ncbi:MAG: hypothetical protein AAB198_04860 [Actinomycetota bacterium]|mgnify:CR=1 FL=1
MNLDVVLDHFAEVVESNPIHTEAAMCDLIAQAFRDTVPLDPHQVVREYPLDGKRVDIWVAAHACAVEAKFHREVRSGVNRPLTMQFGQLLADIRRLAGATAARQRALVLITDASGTTHLENKALLPTSTTVKTLGPKHIATLPDSARRPVEFEGPWIPVRVTRVWKRRVRGTGQAFAWEIEPIGDI